MLPLAVEEVSIRCHHLSTLMIEGAPHHPASTYKVLLSSDAHDAEGHDVSSLHSYHLLAPIDRAAKQIGPGSISATQRRYLSTQYAMHRDAEHPSVLRLSSSAL